MSTSTWLLVDDEPLFLRQVAGALQQVVRDFSQRGSSAVNSLPAVVETATSAQEALQRIEASLPHLVIADLRMPDVDGYQLLRLVHRRWPDVRKVILSGGDVHLTAESLEQAGIELVLRKPRNSNELLALFETLSRLGFAATDPVPTSKPVKKAARVTGRIVRESSSQRQTASSSGFRGELPGIGLLELLQMLVHAGNSSCLTIQGADGTGCLWLDQGHVLHASAQTGRATLEGEAAVDWIFDQSGGQFSLLPFDPPPRMSLNCPGDHFLMEAVRRLDERAQNPAPVRTVTRHLERRVTVIEETVEEAEVEITSTANSGSTHDIIREFFACSHQGETLAQFQCERPEARQDLLDFFRFKSTQISRSTSCGSVRSTLVHTSTHSACFLHGEDRSSFLLANVPNLSLKTLQQEAQSLPCPHQLLSLSPS
ncbi:MAG: hypothetical protein OHK005_12780 [Candidatus Methylacidiphilales bacterium]